MKRLSMMHVALTMALFGLAACGRDAPPTAAKPAAAHTDEHEGEDEHEEGAEGENVASGVEWPATDGFRGGEMSGRDRDEGPGRR